MKLEALLREIASAYGADVAPVGAYVRKPQDGDDGVELTIIDGDKKHVFGISSSPVFGGMEVVITTREEK